MSGIGGIYYRNKHPVSLEQLQEIANAFAHRGTDNTSCFCSDFAGFTHCMLHDTPESLFEILPGKSHNENLTITWHGRIDNREELIDKTDWKYPAVEATDSKLILAAYEKWGEDCVKHLLGDFAFAIWDKAAQQMFCARDHMGIKPFYYVLTDSLFAFGSEIKGLLTLKECSRMINEERIADYLSCIVTENESTFYNTIFRLPPGHSLKISGTKTTFDCYWKPHPTRVSDIQGKNYEEQFYSIFSSAVKCRLRSGFPVGSFLSGGLDSASIVCMSANIRKPPFSGPLHTFSGIFDEIENCDERKYFQSVLDRYDLLPHLVDADTIDPGKAYDMGSGFCDEPFWAPGFFMGNELLEVAKQNGIRVLLDGHDGDSAVSYGYGLLSELFLQGRWLSLIKECHFTSNSPTFTKTIRHFLRVCKNTTLYKIPSNLPVVLQPKIFPDISKYLNPAFIPNCSIKDRILVMQTGQAKPGQIEIDRHLSGITHPLHPLTLEFLDKHNAQYNIEGRYPFFDKRLIEFCLALPSEQKLSKGFNRNIVRKSLNSILPRDITRRKDKTNFMPSITNAFSDTGKKWLSFQVDSLCDQVYSYSNRCSFQQLYKKFLEKPAALDLFELGFILRTVCLSQWLQKGKR